MTTSAAKANRNAEIVDRLEAEIERLTAALKRLGGMEAFTHTHAIPPTMTGDELRARIQFARDVVEQKGAGNVE